jgi:uncharacterized protein (DUF2147 family)
MRRAKLRSFLFVLAALAPLPAVAEELLGEWSRDDGNGSVRFAPCGDALCGTITAKTDPKARGSIGQRVFYAMKPDGANSWRGSAFNPEDGREYTGKMMLAGGRLTTAGCVLGGIICKSLTWSRAK